MITEIKRTKRMARWGAFALGLFLTLGPVSHARAQVSFDPAANFATGVTPNAVAVGDVNNDGKLDLAVVNGGAGENDVSILLGNGDGTFGPKNDFATGAAPNAIAIGDVNNDGKLDLAVVNGGANTLSILTGNGDGTFALASSPATGNGPNAIAIGDVNNDGDLDLAVVNNVAQTVSVLRGNGNGTFALISSPITGNGPNAIVIADLNNDGDLDLAVVNGGANTLSIFTGVGTGAFALASSPATGNGPNAVGVGDFDGDGNLDLAVTNGGAGENDVSILLGNGDGTFAAKTDFATGAAPNAVRVGDFDGDGNLDLAVTNGGVGENDVSILLGNGDGTFAAKTDFATGASPNALGVGDLDRDGKPDLAVVNGGANSVSVLANTTVFTAFGSFALAVNVATGDIPLSVAIGDLDNDGNLDLAVVESGSETVTAFFGDGMGNFPAKTVVDLAGNGPRAVAIGDVNNDGKLDLAVVNNGAQTVSVFLGNGAGGFALASSPATGNGPNAIAIGDVNNDGDLDLAVVNSTPPPPANVSILLGNGTGTFALASSPATGFTPNAVAIGDIDRDGNLDLAVTNQDADTVSILTGNGDGTFALASSPATGFTPSAVAIGDIDRDGDLDLAVTNQDANTVSVFLGIGDGTFSLVSSPSTGQIPQFIVIGDLDGDGDLDLAVANSADDTVSILRNTPETPSAPGAAAGGGGAVSGDGKCFIATAAFGSTLAPQVQLLREFRDLYLLPHPAGEMFVALYYRLSPPVAEQIAESEILRAMVRAGLVPIIGWVTLFLWSPILGLGVSLAAVGFGGWLPLRAARPRRHTRANHSVPQAEDDARPRRAALWRRLVLWSCILFVLSAVIFLEVAHGEQSPARSRIELVGDVVLPHAMWFALIRDPESAQLGLYKDGEPIFEGQSALPLGKITAVDERTLIITLPSGQAVEIPQGARLPGPHGLIFVRSALIDALRFQVRMGGADKTEEHYSVVEIVGRRATLQRDTIPDESRRASLAEMVNRIPFVEVAPDTFEIPEQSLQGIGNHVEPLLTETLRSASPTMTMKNRVALKLHNSLGSGTLDGRGFTVAYAKLARRTGLKVGDVILSVNDQPVNSAGGLFQIYWHLKSDSSVSEVKVLIERNSKLRTLTYHIR